MKKVNKIIFMILIIIGVMFISKGVEATSITVSPSAPEKGKSVTITVSVPNVNTVDLTATVSGAGTSGTIRLVDGSMTGDPKTFSKSITVTPTSTGTITVTVSSNSNAVLNGNYVDVSASKNITVTEPTPVQETPPPTNTGTSSSSSNNSSSSSSSSGSSSNSNKPSTNTTTTVTKSSNSKLDSLEIAEGAITPEFSSGTKEYSVSVPNEVTKLSISAVADSSKATVKITGNEELQVGDNNIEVVVTAEDGSKTTYKILAKRAQPALNLQALTVAYVDENGERVELLLNPVFSFDIYEYGIDTIIPHTIKNLEILGTANRENANIEILGNEELKTGENEITVKVTVTDEAGLEEQKTYTIKVQKEEAPVVTPLSTKEKIGKWFSGIGAWISRNYEKITTGMLLIATTAFVGLTIYFVYDYKNYKKLLAILAQLNKSNLMERANVALDPELANPIEENNNIEQIKQNEDVMQENEEKEEAKIGKGRRFK